MPRKKKPDGPIPPSIPLFREPQGKLPAKRSDASQQDRTAKPTVSHKEKAPSEGTEESMWGKTSYPIVAHFG